MFTELDDLKDDEVLLKFGNRSSRKRKMKSQICIDSQPKTKKHNGLQDSNNINLEVNQTSLDVDNVDNIEFNETFFTSEYFFTF